MIGEVALVLTLGLCLALYFYRPRLPADLPPTVPAPKSRGRRWIYYTEMAKQYGEITSFVERGRITVVLNSAEIATELLERRSAIYSSRPPQHLLSVARAGALGGWMPYGDRWKRWHRLVHDTLMNKAAASYAPCQQAESAVALHKIVTNSETWSSTITEFSICVATQIAYGYRPRDIGKDPLLERNTIAERAEQKLGTSHSILEQWPILRWAPSFLIPVLGDARVALQRDTAFFAELFDAVKKRMETGNPPWSIARDFHSGRYSTQGFSHEELAFTSALPLSTGIGTVTGHMRVFAFACAMYGPTFLPRAKAELDAFVGLDRLPNLNDLASLPFIGAIGDETLRWGRIAPLALPHATTKEDMVNSNGHLYRIPRGATVLLNNFAISWDPSWYPEPEAFKPQRFLEERRPFTVPLGHFAFGAGRRRCPGAQVAQNAYLILIARLVWAFEIVATGTADVSEENWVDVGIGRFPRDIPIEFRCRSDKHRHLIAEEYRIASIELEQCESM